MAEKPIHILLVDDDEDDYIITRDLLQEAGGNRFNLEWVDTYERAVEVIEQKEHDLYLFDYRLGERNGLDLLRFLLSRGIRTPRILLTAQGDREIDMAALGLEASDYLDKHTLSAELLERSIRYVLDRNRAEDAQRESEEKLRAITDAAADGIVLIDHKANISYWNPGAERIFGYKADEVMGREMHLIIAPEDFHDAYREGFRKFKETGQGKAVGRTLEFTAIRKGGEPFPIEVSVSGVKIGGKWNAAGIIRDISERKGMEEELLRDRKFRSVGILAGGFAHDYNNLLAAIMGNLSLAEMSIDRDHEVFEFLTEMKKATLQAKDLTKKIVAFAKGGGYTTNVAPISTLLKRVMERTLGESEVTCELAIADDLRPVEMDGYQIGQVIDSLLVNAVEGISARHEMAGMRGLAGEPPSGLIKITAGNICMDAKNPFLLKEGMYVKVSIQDNGIGISHEQMDQVFDPYFSTKEMGTQKGMGLGLSISRAIIKKHHGNIRVESKTGVGTTIHFYLPGVDEIASEHARKIPEVDRK